MISVSDVKQKLGPKKWVIIVCSVIVVAIVVSCVVLSTKKRKSHSNQSTHSTNSVVVCSENDIARYSDEAAKHINMAEKSSSIDDKVTAYVNAGKAYSNAGQSWKNCNSDYIRDRDNQNIASDTLTKTYGPEFSPISTETQMLFQTKYETYLANTSIENKLELVRVGQQMLRESCVGKKNKLTQLIDTFNNAGIAYTDAAKYATSVSNKARYMNSVALSASEIYSFIVSKMTISPFVSQLITICTVISSECSSQYSTNMSENANNMPFQTATYLTTAAFASHAAIGGIGNNDKGPRKESVIKNWADCSAAWARMLTDADGNKEMSSLISVIRFSATATSMCGKMVRYLCHRRRVSVRQIIGCCPKENLPCLTLLCEGIS